jgi:hypothetical protein
MRRATFVFLLLMTIFAPASARASTPPAPVPPAPAATPAPAVPATPAAPVQTQLALQFDRVGGPRATALTGSPVVVRGTTGAFAPDQTVVVRFYVAGHKLAARRVSLLAQGTGGGFAVAFRSPRPGALVVLATHDATAALGGFATRTSSVDVIPRSVAPRSGRTSIRALQRRLRGLGYVTGAPGVYDERTGRAVLAFRKVTGMARNANATTNVMGAIARGAGRFVVAHPEHGRHVEADLSRQVMALIDGGRAVAIYPISSGKPSTPTVLGSYRVYTKSAGTNEKGMVDSSVAMRSTATSPCPSTRQVTVACGCRFPTSPPCSTGSRSGRLSTSIRNGRSSLRGVAERARHGRTPCLCKARDEAEQKAVDKQPEERWHTVLHPAAVGVRGDPGERLEEHVVDVVDRLVQLAVALLAGTLARGRGADRGRAVDLALRVRRRAIDVLQREEHEAGRDEQAEDDCEVSDGPLEHGSKVRQR